MAEGVAAAGSLHVVSSNSGTRFADLGAAGSLVAPGLPAARSRPVPSGGEAAVAAGAGAVALTVDTPYPGSKRGVDDEDWSGIDLELVAQPTTRTPTTVDWQDAT